MEKATCVIGDRECIIYGQNCPELILIQPVDDHDIEGLDNEVNYISDNTDASFVLAAFKINDWNKELSPWKAEAVFGNDDFGDDAEETLKYVTDILIPEINYRYVLKEDTSDHLSKLNHLCNNISDNLTGGMSEAAPCIIGGYSLAGLFALWSVYNTDMFDAVSAASPSVWFPGWMDYIYDSHYKCNTIYLSLGDKEEKAKNPVMAAVGDNIRAMAEYYGKITGLNSVLEWNQGNHFRDADIRTAKGFVWTVNTVMNKNMNKDMKG